MKRGEIYLATLSQRSGSEQTGTRPVLVISHNAFNQTPGWNSIIIVPISTSDAQAERGPTAIPLKKGIGGLKKDSVALCHQVTTLDRSKCGQRLGNLSPELMKEIEQGLKMAMDLI